jgi:hypothetical protein
MGHVFNRGEAINALIDAAYAGRISRRRFCKALVAAGFTAAVARDMAEHAALAQANQGARLADLKDEYDYIIVGAGSAGCVMAYRLSQDGRSRVLVIEGGGTNLDQDKITDPCIYTRNFGTDTDWGYKSAPQAHLNNRVIGEGRGRAGRRAAARARNYQAARCRCLRHAGDPVLQHQRAHAVAGGAGDRAHSERSARGGSEPDRALIGFLRGACPFRKTGIHFSGTCAGRRLLKAQSSFIGAPMKIDAHSLFRRRACEARRRDRV